MADNMEFTVKPAEKRMKGIFDKLGMIAKPTELRRVVKTCMIVTQGMIADQFKQGGNVINAKSPLDYTIRKWQNDATTTKRKARNGWSIKPGEMTGRTKKNFIARNRSAYPVAKADLEGFRLQMSSNLQKLKKKTRKRQYIGYFEDNLGIIPSAIAIKKVCSFIIRGNITRKMEGKKI
jgi:hypothetical protein